MTPVSCCAFSSTSASAKLSEIGISIWTCLPAFMHWTPLRRVHLRRFVARIIASSPSCFKLSAKSPVKVRDLKSLRDFLRRSLIAARQRNDFNSWNILNRFEMFNAERTLSGNSNFHSL